MKLTTADSLDALLQPWQATSGVELVPSGTSLTVRNTTAQRQVVCLQPRLNVEVAGSLLLQVAGRMLSGTGVSVTVEIDDRAHYPAPLDSTNRFKVRAGASVRVKLELNGQTAVDLTALHLSIADREVDLFESELRDGRVLLVTPTYPSSHHLYLSGFVHARVREYQLQGLRPAVFCSFTAYEYQTVYEFEGVRVLRGHTSDLLAVLNRVEFARIALHFFDEFYAHVLDRAVRNDQTDLVLWCHGPETLFWDLPLVNGPYFSRPQPPDGERLRKYRLLEHYAKKYAQRRNVHWVFVSDWQRRRSEELLGIHFDTAKVIANFVDERHFPYRPKTAEDRKNVFILRRFDDEKKYAVDVTVMALLALSRRECFRHMTFHVYGDGGAHERLLAPLRRFDNVVIHRQFLDHAGIAEAHARCGIALFPTRYDAQGVSACEAASSGLVVVSTHSTAVPEFIPPELGTLVAGDDPGQMVEIIERLYNDPEHFLDASRRLSEHVRALCSYQSTIQRELKLLTAPLPRAADVAAPEEVDKLLTVVVPTFNMAACLARCVESMLHGPRSPQLEVLIVDDGSTDGSREVAQKLAARHPGIVRVIAKENGGHGSTINRGLKEARGRYFRVVDSDDWVDSFAFATFLERLREETADVVLTDHAEDWLGHDVLVPRPLYSNLTPGQLYDFDVLADPTYGFTAWGPVLATASFKTELLRRAGLQLSEKIAYVDMEYCALSLTHVTTARYYDLDVYRYCLGQANQSVSQAGFTRRYKQHEQVIRRICDFVRDTPELSEAKRGYVVRQILQPMIKGHLSLLRESIRDPAQVQGFQELIRSYPFVRNELAEEVLLPNGSPMLKVLKQHAATAARNALPFTFVANLEPNLLDNPPKAAKYLLKYFTPYGLVMRLKR